MARLALLIGCPVGAIYGVEQSLHDMAAFLGEQGFTCEALLGDAATRAAILAALERLLLKTRHGDAVVFYYAGHGELLLARSADDLTRPERARTQGLMVTSDMACSDAEHFLGVVGIELSLLVAELGRRTDNVTAILDCCHATEILPHLEDETAARSSVRPVALDLARALVRKRVLYRGDTADTVVRLMASTAGLEAYADASARRLLFTQTLLETLRGDRVLNARTWDSILREVRERVLAVNDAQRPSVSGARWRLPFSTESRPEPGEFFHVQSDIRGPQIVDAVARGLACGDVFDLRGYLDEDLGRAWVGSLTDRGALLHRDRLGELPAWCWACRVGQASPLRVALTGEVGPGLSELLRKSGFAMVAEIAAASARIDARGEHWTVALIDAGEHRMLATGVAADPRLIKVLRRIEHWLALQRWVEAQAGGLAHAVEISWSVDGEASQAEPMDTRGRRDLGIHVHNSGGLLGQVFVEVLRVSADLDVTPWGDGWMVQSGHDERRRLLLTGGASPPIGVIVLVANGAIELGGVATPVAYRGLTLLAAPESHGLGQASRLELIYRKLMI